VSNLEINTGQSLKECYFLFNQKIGSFTFELFVRLFLNYNYDVAWLNSWILVCFTVENIRLVIRCTFVDFCLYYLFFFYDLFTIASFAFVLVVYNFTFTVAIIARPRRLCVHTWSELLHSRDHTSTFTCWALLDSAFFATLTFTLCANSFSVDCNFGLFSSVNFFESDF